MTARSPLPPPLSGIWNTGRRTDDPRRGRRRSPRIVEPPIDRAHRLRVITAAETAAAQDRETTRHVGGEMVRRVTAWLRRKGLA